MHHSQSVTVSTNAQFESDYRKKVQLLLMSSPVNRGPAHATTDESMTMTHEILHLTEAFEVGHRRLTWAEVVKPNLPWAEDHFQERVSGKPMNPSPSEAWWPFAREGNAEHKSDEVFSHTYPERFWPKYAGVADPPTNFPEMKNINWGIRYPYGDLNDLIRVLTKNVNSRQAYLPIWFPEDLEAAKKGLRVPCSMGYHFIRDPKADTLDCVYTMRSCDIVRFYRDDLYMAGRLLQWVAHAVKSTPGKLVVHIDNLHCFPGDRYFLESLFPKVHISNEGKYPEDPRKGYNFGAMG